MCATPCRRPPSLRISASPGEAGGGPGSPKEEDGSSCESGSCFRLAVVIEEEEECSPQLSCQVNDGTNSSIQHSNQIVVLGSNDGRKDNPETLANFFSGTLKSSSATAS